MAAQPMKEAMVVCLDVGRSMWAKGSASLAEAQKALSLLVQQKVMDGKKTEQMGFVLFGTEETKNDLYDPSAEGYEHVTVCREIVQPDLELIRTIENDIHGEDAEGDLVDAIVVSLDMLERHTHGKKFSKRLIIVTDGGSPCNPDKLDDITQEMNNQQMKVQIFGLDFDEQDAPPEVKEESRERKSQTKIANEHLIWGLEKLIDQFELIPMKEALERLSYFRERNIRQTTLFRGMLDIAEDAMQIPVMVYTQSAEAKMPQFKSIFVNDEKELVDVNRETTYFTADEANEELQRDSLIKGYRYGKDLVPINDVDEQQMAVLNDRCLSVIGFAKSSEVLREHYVSNVLCVAPQVGDSKAAVALSSLAHALYELDHVAIVRYVWRKNANARLGFLWPHIKPNNECLYFTQLPFAEDIRDYTFASLSKFKPADAQIDAMDKFIQKLDLMTAGFDYDNEMAEDLKPRNTPNVALHRVQEAIKLRALCPGASLPDVNPALARTVERNKKMWEGAKAEIAEVEQLFPVRKSETAEKRGVDLVWGQTATAEEDLAQKRNKLGDNSLKLLAEEKVSNVGTINPVADFRAMIQRRDVDMVSEAFRQMKKMIHDIVETSFLDVTFEKAVSCLKAMREEAIKEDEPKLFNEYLVELGDTYKDKRNGFWKRVHEAEKMTLISSDECDESDVAPADAQKFLLVKDAKPAPVVQPRPKADDVDDLLAQMD